MKGIIKLGFAGIMACGIGTVHAQQINPMTEAVLRDYAEILAENPKDYYTLYDRASQYITLGDYDRALSDIDMALEYTPESDKDYRIAEYSLKCDVLTLKKEYAQALQALQSALAINPTSQPELYKAGNLNLMLGNSEDALKAFQALQRENPRSQEAFYGMAKAYAMAGNTREAENLIKEVEQLGKQSFLTYCRIGDLYADMGNVKDAVTNYAIAYSMEDNSSRPVESLKTLSRKSPEAVMETLNSLIQANPDNITTSYLKAIVAFDGGNYKEAEQACKTLAQGLEEDSPAVYRMMAVSQLAQNKTADALESINTAERLAPSNTGILMDKAMILMSGNPEEAYNTASKALTLEPENEVALMTAAKTAIAAGKYEEAKNYLNNVVLSNPSNAEALLLRGYVNTENLNDAKSGVTDYTRAGNIHPETNRDRVLAALGKAKINKKLDADGMINEAIGKAGNNKDDLYMIAIYFAQTGNLEKAKEFADKAMINGYGNIYNLQQNKEPLFNLQPIRHLMGN